MRVAEIFYSIQGESLDVGRPCVLVRLAGCNLRCDYCDTRYAWNDGRMMALDEILEEVAGLGCNLVEVTGGEPLMQVETPLLIKKLLDRGYEVLLETNGSYDISVVDGRCAKIVDIKCPGSGAADQMDLDNLGRLSPRDQLKFVLADRADYEYARDLVKSRVDIRGERILFSPVVERLRPVELAAWILADHLEIRFQLQLHKILWPGRERGI